MREPPRSPNLLTKVSLALGSGGVNASLGLYLELPLDFLEHMVVCSLHLDHPFCFSQESWSHGCKRLATSLSAGMAGAQAQVA